MTHPLSNPFSFDKIKSLPLHALLLGLGTVILAVHPVAWLVQTWMDPAYDSCGAWIFAAVVLLFAWSASSSPLKQTEARKPFAIAMLMATSLLRLLSQVLAINILGAMALVVDIYALGLLAGLPGRQRAISPGWLAILFAFSLPLTNLLQRTAGYILQLVSAQGAGGLLSLFFPGTTLEGVRIFLAGKEILVDLPCSGAQCTTMLLLLFAVLMTVQRPRLLPALMGSGLVLVLAFVSNTARITMMALGVAFPDAFGGIDVLVHPWHDLIGTLTLLLLGFVPMLAWSGHFTGWNPLPANWTLPVASMTNRLGSLAVPKRLQVGFAMAFLMGALVITQLPHAPLDVSESLPPVYLPASINHANGKLVALTVKEQAYFTRYGGHAAKMQYGDQALMVVQTTAPLRHLHSPADCLRGLGFQVKYLGVENRVLPSAVYRATSIEGKSWRVAVSFVSKDSAGHLWATPSVAEAIWHWFQNPDEPWLAIQRITPAETSVEKEMAWDRSVAIALDLPIQHKLRSKNIQISVKPIQSEGVE